jgi:hypothetical protein
MCGLANKIRHLKCNRCFYLQLEKCEAIFVTNICTNKAQKKKVKKFDGIRPERFRGVDKSSSSKALGPTWHGRNGEVVRVQLPADAGVCGSLLRAVAAVPDANESTSYTDGKFLIGFSLK